MKRLLAPLAFLASASCAVQTSSPNVPPPAPVVAGSGSGVALPAPTTAPPLPYPVSRRVEQTDVLHGATVSDPYRWLEDGSSDEVRKWADAQDGFARSYLAKLPGRDAIAARLKELLYVENEQVPHRYGNRLFYARREAGTEKYVLYWREGRDAPAHVLLDPRLWSSDGSVSLGESSASWDGKTVAYSQKANNSDEATLYVKDVSTGKISDVDVIEGARYASPSWTASGDGFYYTWIPPKDSVTPADRPGYQEVRFHKLGTNPKSDRIIHERTGDPKTFLRATLSKNGRWLIAVTQHGWTRDDVQFMDMHAAKPAWRSLALGQEARYDVEVDGDRFFVRTNDGAPRYRLFRVDPMHAERAAWREIVPERSDASLNGAAVAGHRLVLVYLKDVVDHGEVRDEDGKFLRAIETPTLGAFGASSWNPDDDRFYYSFESFTYPTEIFETSIKTGETRSVYRLKVPVDASKYVVEQLFAKSKDGTRVPFFVVHAKDAAKDGKSPTLLSGYGGFDITKTPAFSTAIFPWLEHGGVWALANLRGGGEYGEEWHRHGMRHEKQNVFDDFAAVGEELVRQGFTTPGKLAVFGRSNGGLLVGAAVTQRPDLFRVAICGVPLLDMVRYHLFGSGKTWIEEYGSADDAEDFKALYAYSPYHHVKLGTKYGAILLLGADSDDRVDPMHARKFAAELQWASSGGPVLLRIEKHSGHGGADLVKSDVDQLADEYAFALDRMND